MDRRKLKVKNVQHNMQTSLESGKTGSLSQDSGMLTSSHASLFLTETVPKEIMLSKGREPAKMSLFVGSLFSSSTLEN